MKSATKDKVYRSPVRKLARSIRAGLLYGSTFRLGFGLRLNSTYASLCEFVHQCPRRIVLIKVA